jgi:integrase
MTVRSAAEREWEVSVTEIKGRPGYYLVVVYDRVSEMGARPKKQQKIIKGQRAAEKYERDRLRKREKGSLVGGAQTLAEYADRYLASRKAEVSAQTFHGYSSVVDRYITPYPIGSLRLEAVSRTAVATFYVDVLENGARRRGVPIQPDTVRGIHRVLSMILARACDDGLIHRNPCKYAKPPKDDRVQEDREPGVDPEIARVFLEYAEGTPICAIAALAIGTGLRRSELVALRWQDVDFEACTLEVNGKIEQVPGSVERKAPKSKRGRRKVPFGPGAAAVLRRQRALIAKKKLKYQSQVAEVNGKETALWADEPWVFPSLRVSAAKDGSLLPAGRLWTPSAFAQEWRQTRDDINARRLAEFVFAHEPIDSDDELAAVVVEFEPWEFGIHELRHTFATSQLAGRVRDEVVSRRMGHSDSYITRRVYSHVVEAESREGVDIADSLL